MPSNSTQPSSPATSDRDSDELEMRRALGLGAASADRPAPFARTSENHPSDRPKRRFVSDGEVPVVVVQARREFGNRTTAPAITSPVNRLDAAQAALAAEREAREAAERSLAEAQAVIRELQTKLGHASLAREELRAAAQRADAARQAAETALAAERDARVAAEDAVKAASGNQDAAERRVREPRPARTTAVRGRPARKIPATELEDEPEPVQWWLLPAKNAG
jgi:hypothetical protein